MKKSNGKWIGSLMWLACICFLLGVNTLKVEADEGSEVNYITDSGGGIGIERHIDGEWYLIDCQTDTYVNGFVFLENGNKWVYYSPVNGQMLHGEQYINGHWYLFDFYTGAVQYGFQYIEKDHKWVFYDQITGWMLYGEQYINNSNFALE